MTDFLGAETVRCAGNRRRKGGCASFEESHLALQYRYIDAEMERLSRKYFPEPKNSDSGWACPIFPPAQFLEVPCNTVITTILQPHNMGNRADSWYDEQP